MKTLPTINVLVKEFKKDNGVIPSYLFVGDNEFFDLSEPDDGVYCGMSIVRVCAKNHLEVGSGFSSGFPGALYVGIRKLLDIRRSSNHLGKGEALPLLAIPMYLCVDGDTFLLVRTVQ